MIINPFKVDELDALRIKKPITYYVNANTGSDANNGLSANTAFKTIQHAIDILPRQIDYAVNIEFAEGTYDKVTIAGFNGEGRLTVSGTNEELCVVKGIQVWDVSTQVALKHMTITIRDQEGLSEALGVRRGVHTDCYECTVRGTSASGERGFVVSEGATLALRYCRAYNLEQGIAADNCGRVFAGGMAGSGVMTGFYSGDGGQIHEGHGWGVLDGYNCTTLYHRERSGILVKQDGTLVS